MSWSEIKILPFDLVLTNTDFIFIWIQSISYIIIKRIVRDHVHEEWNYKQE